MNHSMFIGCNAPLKVDNHKDEEDGDEVSNCQGGEGRGGVTNGLSRTMNGESEKWGKGELISQLHSTVIYYTAAA